MEEIDPVQQVSSVQSPGWLMIIVVFNGILTMHIWVCLEIGYTPNYSHLIGIMIINHWV